MKLSMRAFALVLAGWIATPAFSYSVLSHEALVDAMWDVQLRGFLLERYPTATKEELKRAHGFAYGGSIIQDLGYYPRGSKEFSDLTHYVRTGDFIVALIKDASNLNELAFGLGAMSHYVGDLDGHKRATNVAEPLLYPKLREKFGDFITYEDSPSGHLRTEFGFDVIEVARGNFAPQGYHDFIGFDVTKELVRRAFRETYGLELADLFGSFDGAVSSYRSAVSRTIPLATRVAWAQRRDEIAAVQPGATHRQFVYVMKRSSYEREWGKRLQEPNVLEKFLGFLVRLIPPIGPLSALQLKMPTPEAEHLFMASFNRAATQYSDSIDDERRNQLLLPDVNYDVGDPTPAGVYRLNDDTMAFWLDKLADKKFATVTPEIEAKVLDFYQDLSAPINTKKKPVEWQRTLGQLAGIRKVAPRT